MAWHFDELVAEGIDECGLSRGDAIRDDMKQLTAHGNIFFNL